MARQLGRDRRPPAAGFLQAGFDVLDVDGERSEPSGETVHVVEVVDGDTLKVDRGGETVTVRLIGVDTPETVHPSEPVQCFGAEASAHATDLAEGTRVRLEHDPSQGEVDAYGRELAYVVLDDDRMLNLLLIAEGYGLEYTYDDPYRHQQEFRGAQAAAEADEVGLWAPDTCDGNTDQPAN